MKHIREILQDEGFLVDRRTQVVGIDAAETYEHLGAPVTTTVLEDVGANAWDTSEQWSWPRGVLVDPHTGLIEQVVLLDLRCELVPTDHPEA